LYLIGHDEVIRGAMKASKTIAIGVMPQAKLRERVLAVARGDYKPKASDPKIWFTSMKAAADVLSDENRALLRTIPDHELDRLKAEVSVQRLVEASGVVLTKQGADWIGRCPFHDDIAELGSELGHP
jgi:predicted transcriptional regulator